MADLSPEVLSGLRPHVINLNQGRFSSTGVYRSTEADVEDIVRVHLPRWVERSTADELRVVLWAHGGLVSEESGLRVAADQVSWWLANGVYPLFFVWETGFVDALKQILVPAPRSRDLWDVTTDPVVEAGARVMGGPKLWAAMKTSAINASAPDGAATRVLELLREFSATVGDRVRFHAVGHSAGSIFHAELLSRAAELGLPAFSSLSLLAPAMTTEAWHRRLEPLVGRNVGSLRLYTMRREFEQDDYCGTEQARIYHKSLLYLIHRALEPEPRTPILGLEDSLRDDPGLRSFFGLDGSPGRAAVVWSVTPGESSSVSHGGFDNDADTMNSVARGVLDVAGLASPFEDHHSFDSARRLWQPREDRVGDHRPPASPGGGRRRALCIGIDAYPGGHALSGCVADANLWAETLRRLDFTVDVLTDGNADRSTILERVERHVGSLAPGDVGVLQYSGHGTQVEDQDSDEPDHLDEAICPIDFETGALILDDDLRAIFATLVSGADLTSFMDCCFSESNTRLLRVHRPLARAAVAATPRFVRRSSELDSRHTRFRRAAGARSTPGPASRMPTVAFSACQDFEVALESAGQGHFTRAATRLLAESEGSNCTNAEFLTRILGRIEPGQVPALEPAGDQRPLLGVYLPAV